MTFSPLSKQRRVDPFDPRRSRRAIRSAKYRRTDSGLFQLPLSIRAMARYAAQTVFLITVFMFLSIARRDSSGMSAGFGFRPFHATRFKQSACYSAEAIPRRRCSD